MELCPYTNEDPETEEIIPSQVTEEHLTWHLDWEVKQGRLVKHSDGTYSLAGPLN